MAESVRPKLDGNEQTIDPDNGAGHTRANYNNTRGLFQPLITAAEAAKLLNLHHVTVLRWARQGRLPHLRLGRKIMFRASALDAWCTESYTRPAVRAA